MALGIPVGDKKFDDQLDYFKTYNLICTLRRFRLIGRFTSEVKTRSNHYRITIWKGLYD